MSRGWGMFVESTKEPTHESVTQARSLSALAVEQFKFNDSVNLECCFLPKPLFSQVCAGDSEGVCVESWRGKESGAARLRKGSEAVLPVGLGHGFAHHPLGWWETDMGGRKAQVQSHFRLGPDVSWAAAEREFGGQGHGSCTSLRMALDTDPPRSPGACWQGRPEAPFSSAKSTLASVGAGRAQGTSGRAAGTSDRADGRKG